MKYDVVYYWRAKQGYSKSEYECRNRAEADQIIKEISRLAIKRDYVELYEGKELIVHKVF